MQIGSLVGERKGGSEILHLDLQLVQPGADVCRGVLLSKRPGEVALCVGDDLPEFDKLRVCYVEQVVERGSVGRESGLNPV